MRPTQAGEILLPYARQILALQAETKARLSEQQTGTLTIGTIETLAAFYLPPVLQAFRETYPRMTITLQSGNEASIVQAVKDGQYDLGLILDHLSADPELVCVPLRKDEFAIISGPDSPYNQLSEITVQDLTHARLILTEAGCTYRALLLQALRQANIPHRVVWEFGSLEAIKQCVMCGLGIAFLPCVTVQEEITQGKLQAFPFAFTSNLYTQVIYLERKWQSQAFQDLLNLMSSASSVSKASCNRGMTLRSSQKKYANP